MNSYRAGPGRSPIPHSRSAVTLMASAAAALLVAGLAQAAFAGEPGAPGGRDGAWDDILFYDWEEIPADAAGDDGDEIPFSVATVLAELNHSDGDLGFHALIDGDPWRLLAIEDPDERVLLNMRIRDSLRLQGLTELFFESAEPPFDELTPEEFFARFPEGDYEVSGVSIEGEELESLAGFTHLLPAPPEGIIVSSVFVNPEAVDCDEGPVPAVREPVTISWDPVTLSHPDVGRTGEPLDVVKYQIVVEREEPTLLIYSVDLPPDVTELDVPAGFTALGESFKFEILVREASGNQTAVESCFEIWTGGPA